MRIKSAFRRRASSLVITLMVIVVLSIIVVAFLQSMTIERKTATSYSNVMKARLAAEAGIEQAVARIQSALPTTNATALANGFIVWTWGKDANFYTTYTGILPNIYDTNSSSQGVDHTVWLFSCSNAASYNPDGLLLTQTLAPSNSCNINGSTNLNDTYRVTTVPTAINVDWLTLTNVTNSTIQTIRTAYWVSDEGGRLPLAAVGNNANISSNSGRIIDLKLSGLSNTEVSALVANRAVIANLGGLSYLEAAGSATNSPNSFSTIGTNLSGRIHYGGFFMQPRTNINLIYSNSGNAASFITTFTNIVKNALPDYAARKEGTNGTLARIAASLYDYIDPDDTPTLSPDLASYFAAASGQSSAWTYASSSYYGVESGPKLNEYVFYSGTASAAATQYSYSTVATSVGVTRIFELWNMSQKTNTLTQITARIFNQPTTSVFGGDDIPSSPNETISFTNTIVMAPNSYATLTNSQVFTSPGDSKLDYFDNPAETNKSYRPKIVGGGGMGVIITANVNGTPMLVDAAYPMELQARPVGGKAGCNPGFNGSAELSDGRINISQNLAKWANSTGTNHTVGLVNNKVGAIYQQADGWFDRPLVGGSQNESPMSAPVYIKNGPLDYIGELGNIWDPSADIVDTNGRAQGGKTLVIGQFDPYTGVQNGTLTPSLQDYASYLKRADSTLLDVFTVNNDARFNINSPRPKNETNRPFVLLASSFEGITNNVFPQTNAPSFSGAGIEAAVTARLGGMSWRLARPFRNMADLTALGSFTNTPAKPFVGTTTNFWMGSGGLWASNAPGSVSVKANPPFGQTITVADGDDRSREEAFRRLANFVDFTSLAFRVYGAGQVLDKNGKVQARVNLQAIVTFTPKIISTNPTTGVTTAVSYTPSIRYLPLD